MALAWSDSIADVDWDALAALYRAAPLGDKRPQDLAIVFANSRHRCLVRDGDALVAAGRLLSDGLDCAYLCDVAVLPAYQGRGLGKAVVLRLLDRVRDHRKIILYAVPGKEPFYRRLGFRRMTTAMAIFENAPAALARGVIAED